MGNVNIDYTLNERLVDICKRVGRNDLIVKNIDREN